MIASAQNPRFRELLSLAESPRSRREAGLWVEGRRMVDAARAAGCSIRVLVATPETAVEAEAAFGLEPCVVAAPLFKRLSLVASPQGIAAWVARPEAQDLDPRRDLLLLDRLQDPGNVGTLLRTAAAAGIGQVVLLSGSTEAHSPKALRAGMGAQFGLSIHEGLDWQELSTIFDVPWVATVAPDHPGAQSLYAASLEAHPALVWCMGQEGQGLSAELLSHPRAWHLTIPQSNAVESLNVAAAAAVCLFERRRQQLAAVSG